MESAAKSPQTHDEFGALLCVRGAGLLERVTALVFAAVLLLIGTIVLPYAVMTVSGKPVSAATAGCVTLVCMVLAAALIASVFRRVHFYERGAVQRKPFRKAVSLAYREIETFVFSTRREFYSGGYVGTTLDIRLKPGAPDKRRIRLIGKYKERPRTLLGATAFAQDLMPDEEMDRVRERITSAVAMEWVPRFERGEAIDWCGAGHLTPAGFTPKRGKKKGELVPFEAITCSTGNGYLQLFADGKKWPFCIVPVNGRNFYVGLHLMQLMAPEDQLSVGEGAEFAAGREERSV